MVTQRDQRPRGHGVYSIIVAGLAGNAVNDAHDHMRDPNRKLGVDEKS